MAARSKWPVCHAARSWDRSFPIPALKRVEREIPDCCELASSVSLWSPRRFPRQALGDSVTGPSALLNLLRTPLVDSWPPFAGLL